MKKVILISLISLFANCVFGQLVKQSDKVFTNECELKVRLYVSNDKEHLNALSIATDKSYYDKMEFEIICVEIADDFPKDMPVVKMEYYCAKTNFKLASVYSYSIPSKYEVNAYAFESKRILHSIQPFHYENVGYLDFPKNKK